MQLPWLWGPPSSIACIRICKRNMRTREPWHRSRRVVFSSRNQRHLSRMPATPANIVCSALRSSQSKSKPVSVRSDDGPKKSKKQFSTRLSDSERLHLSLSLRLPKPSPARHLTGSYSVCAYFRVLRSARTGPGRRVLSSPRHNVSNDQEIFPPPAHAPSGARSLQP